MNWLTDHYLSKGPTLFVIAKRTHNLIERKDAIDDRFHAIDGYRTVHRDEPCAVAGKNHPQRRDRVVEDVQINCGRLIGQASDEIDLSLKPDRLDRLLESASSDVHHLIDATPLGEFAYCNVPIGCRSVVDHIVCSRSFESTHLVFTRGCHDDSSPEELGELQSEERDATSP